MTVCSISLEALWSWRVLGQTVVLGGIDLVVVLGNALVIAAVVTDRKLHTTTNLLITSLAVSDLLVGLLILPFSISHESLGHVWPFGPVLCEVWLAADVWLCTASIYNLVMVSLDRYMAVTQPLRYRLISSPRLGPLMVLAAWVVSFLICLPQLIISIFSPGATAAARDATNGTHDKANGSLLSALDVADVNETTDADCRCSPTNNDSIYVIYSSFGSFFVPLLLILFLNAGIFRVARNVGKVVVVGSDGKRKSTDTVDGDRTPPTVVTMRVNVGGGGGERTDGVGLAHRSRSSSVPANIAAGHLLTSGNSLIPLHTELFDGEDDNNNGTPPSTATTTAASRSCSDRRKSAIQQLRRLPTTNRMMTRDSIVSQTPSRTSGGKPPLQGTRSLSLAQLRRLSRLGGVLVRSAQRSSSAVTTAGVQRAETQVAKTVGVVVGVFAVCWLPFSLAYLLQAYDMCPIQACIPAAVFNAVFWLGYCNSAANPVIYALFSRDLRRAFRRVLLRMARCCRTTDDGLRARRK